MSYEACPAESTARAVEGYRTIPSEGRRMLSAMRLPGDDSLAERDRISKEVLVRLERLCEWMRREGREHTEETATGAPAHLSHGDLTESER